MLSNSSLEFTEQLPAQIFFNTAPFLDKSDLQILGLVTKGVRPERLNSPRIDDNTWNLITSCWLCNPSERLTMDVIVKKMKLLFS